MHSLKEHLKTIQPSTGVAFFDLDRTLIAGFSIMALAQETVRHAAKRGDLAQSAQVLRDVIKARADSSGGSYHRLVRRLSGALTGVSEEVLERLGERAYSAHIARGLYREAIELVETHRAAGHRLVIVTAASQYQVAPVARELGVDAICCTRLEVIDRHFTGQVIAPLCYGEGKVLTARREAKKHGVKLADCWFYSDSSADLPLLNKVGHPVTVNASERLALLAEERDWPQLRFDSRGLPNLEHLTRTALTAQTLMAATALGMVTKRLGVDSARNAGFLTRLLGDVGSACAGLEFDIEGRHFLEQARPAVFIFNHQSLLDSLVMAYLLREDVVALCKREMAENPVVGPLMRQVDTIFVDREHSDQRAVLEQALGVLSSGRSLVIAPEGTRSTLGDVQPFKHGAFYLANRAGAPLVPIGLHYVKDALPKGGGVIRPARIRVTVLPPVLPQDISSIRETCAGLEQRYADLLARSPRASLPSRPRA